MELRSHFSETFEDRTIDLDGQFFDRCFFRRCKLVYRGGVPAQFARTGFEDCQWQFTGAAANTLTHLANLYQVLKTDDNSIVDAVIASIRTGEMADSVYSAEPVGVS